MLKKSITFTDYNGNTRTEDYYFNLNKAEIAEMQLSVNGGMDVMLQEVIDAKDNATIMKIFKDLILKSYGRKHADGVQFEKSEELSTKFMQSEAYSTLFMELISDSGKAAEFVTGIMPKDLAEELAKNNKA